MNKYLNVDVIAFLEEKMKNHTKHYQSDFELDKDTITKAAMSDRKEDKTLLWMARPMGTYCHKEHEVFIKDTAAHNTWCYYADQTSDPIIACTVEITGIKNGLVYGNVYEQDYFDLAAEVSRRSVLSLEVEKTFEDGFVDRVAIERSSYGYYAGLVEEHGPIVDSFSIPRDNEELSFVLLEQKRKRDKMKAADLSKGKWKIWFETFDDAGRLTGGGVLPNEYVKKADALKHITHLDQAHHRWTVSKTNPWEMDAGSKAFSFIKVDTEIEESSNRESSAKVVEKNGYTILSIEECFDDAYGASIVQYRNANGAISFAFSSVNINDALSNPELVLDELIKNVNDLNLPVWSDLSQSMLNLVVDSAFDMKFVENDDESWTEEMAQRILDEAWSVGLCDVVTVGEDGCLVTVYAGAMGAVNWSGHSEFGKACLEHTFAEEKRLPLDVVISDAKSKEVVPPLAFDDKARNER